MVSAHCCLASLAKCTRLYGPPPVTFSIATRIAEETKRKFLLLWQRCGGGVRFLRDGRRSIVNDVVQGFHVDTRLVAAALVRLVLLLHHPCLWSSRGTDLSNWSFQHMLCQDLQPLLALRSPEILCWLPYKPLSDQNHQPDWNLSSSQDANLRSISFPTITISRASSLSSSSSLKNRRKKTRTRRWRGGRRWGPTYLHEYLGVQFSTTEQQFMHWSAHKKLQKIVNKTTTTTTTTSSSSSMGEIWQQITKVRLKTSTLEYINFTKNLVKNLVMKQSSYTSLSWLSSDINNNNNNNSTSSAAEVEQKILNIIVQKTTAFFLSRACKTYI